MLEDDQLYTPKLLNLQDGTDDTSDGSSTDDPDTEDETFRFFRAWGLFYRICLILQMDCLAISPMFVMFLLTKDKNRVLEDNILAELAPNLSGLLDHCWPPQRIGDRYQISAGSEAYGMVLSFAPDIEVCLSVRLSVCVRTGLLI